MAAVGWFLAGAGGRAGRGRLQRAHVDLAEEGVGAEPVVCEGDEGDVGLLGGGVGGRRVVGGRARAGGAGGPAG